MLRTAPSHLRFGHFEYFCMERQGRRSALIDYARRYHFPSWPDGAELFAEVVRRTARLIAMAGGRVLSRGDEHRQHVPASG